MHARQTVQGGDRTGLERLARYVLRPPLAQARLERGTEGRVILHMKRSWRDATTAVVFEPLDFVAKLAALVPRPRVNALRFHGVYAPNAKLRKQVVAEPNRPAKAPCGCGPDIPSSGTNRLCWAELIKRVFRADVFACPRCNSKMSRIAWITDPEIIRRILRSTGLPTDGPVPHPARPAEDLFGAAQAA